VGICPVAEERQGVAWCVAKGKREGRWSTSEGKLGFGVNGGPVRYGSGGLCSSERRNEERDGARMIGVWCGVVRFAGGGAATERRVRRWSGKGGEDGD
ncbi:hypothetical protein HAX54_048139, partial [Datura stramonium]|nr:hypothetical protein [Datura stramonium]